MTKYTSLLFGVEEYHQIGPLRFPIYKDLVPGEARTIEDIGRKNASSTYKSIDLAKAIANDKKITIKAAIDLLSNANEPGNEDLIYTYAAELEELQNTTSGAVAQQIEFATVMIKFRGEANLDGQGWKKLEDWTEADTEAMPRKVMEEVFHLMLWERDGWPTDSVGNETPSPSTPTGSAKNAKRSSMPSQ